MVPPSAPLPFAVDPGDRALIPALLDGDEEAVQEVRRWVRGACGPYRRLVGADLEDLEQEVLISLLQTLRDGGFSGDSRLATYVRRAVHYKCIDRIRAARRREWCDVEDLELEADQPTPFEEAASRQSVGIVLEVLSRMSEDCRRLWRDVHAGFSYETMSERWGVAAGTLRVRVLRCRRKALAERERLLAERAGGNE